MSPTEVIQDLKQILPYAIGLAVWVLVVLWTKHDDTR